MREIWHAFVSFFNQFNGPANQARSRRTLTRRFKYRGFDGANGPSRIKLLWASAGSVPG